ncbi:MAG: signal peptidase II [Candidatus Shapirobacteria bacterium]|nr:signal peptidase II [Candidatus Shapirobacteria bacterium]
MKKIKKFKFGWLFWGLILETILHWWLSNNSFLIKNYGISLSWNSQNVVFVNIIFVLILGWGYIKNFSWGLGLILIGGMVNLIDRLYFGYIRDYWNLGFGVVNNLNDWIIGIGVLLFLVELLWKKSK